MRIPKLPVFLLLLVWLVSCLAAAPNPDSGIVEYQIGVCLDLNNDQNCTDIDAAARHIQVDVYLSPNDTEPITTLTTDAGGLASYAIGTSFKNLDPSSRLAMREIISSGKYRGCPHKDQSSIRVHAIFEEATLTWKFQDIFPIPLCHSGPSA